MGEYGCQHPPTAFRLFSLVRMDAAALGQQGWDGHYPPPPCDQRVLVGRGVDVQQVAVRAGFEQADAVIGELIGSYSALSSWRLSM